MRTVDLPPRGLLVSPLLSVGPWLSLVERLLGVQEVASSNLAGPTTKSPQNSAFNPNEYRVKRIFCFYGSITLEPDETGCFESAYLPKKLPK